MERWKPRQDVTKREAVILKRTDKRRKLFTFMRLQRDAIFDDAFQEELEAMYRNTGAGNEPDGARKHERVQRRTHRPLRPPATPS